MTRSPAWVATSSRSCSRRPAHRGVGGRQPAARRLNTLESGPAVHTARQRGRGARQAGANVDELLANADFAMYRRRRGARAGSSCSSPRSSCRGPPGRIPRGAPERPRARRVQGRLSAHLELASGRSTPSRRSCAGTIRPRDRDARRLHHPCRGHRADRADRPMVLEQTCREGRLAADARSTGHHGSQRVAAPGARAKLVRDVASARGVRHARRERSPSR